jgi:hypothetical protein
MPYKGASTVADCIPCIGDQSCTEIGQTAYGTQTCPAGYYCDSDGTQNICEAGFYCPDGDVVKYRCEHGTYSDVQATFCSDCLAGQVCLQPEPLDSGTLTYTVEVPGVTITDMNAANCPKGFYCDTGTAIYGQYPCPKGQYGAAE